MKFSTQWLIRVHRIILLVLGFHDLMIFCEYLSSTHYRNLGEKYSKCCLIFWRETFDNVHFLQLFSLLTRIDSCIRLHLFSEKRRGNFSPIFSLANPTNSFVFSARSYFGSQKCMISETKTWFFIIIILFF